MNEKHHRLPKPAVAQGLALAYNVEDFAVLLQDAVAAELAPILLQHAQACLRSIHSGMPPPQLLSSLCLHYSGARAWAPLKWPELETLHGEGGLLLWGFNNDDTPRIDPLEVLLRADHLRRLYPSLLAPLREAFPQLRLPRRLRFGLAWGKISPFLSDTTGKLEYTGLPLLLAARLDHYCAGVGIAASSSLPISQTLARSSGFQRYRATQLKGFDAEHVFVPEDVYARLTAFQKDHYFAPEAEHGNGVSEHMAVPQHFKGAGELQASPRATQPMSADAEDTLLPL